jgi:chorismate-pyruvate lyase
MEADSLECLADIYLDLGFHPPNGYLIAAEEIPPEFNRLLVHQRGMTVTLENAYGQVINIRVLNSIIRNSMLTRQVLLVLRESEISVAMALVRIYLTRFPEPARRLILEQSTPLGTILRLKGLSPYYHSHKYFALTRDLSISRYTTDEDSRQLYGRSVHISDPFGHTLADVVEIILPMRS